MRDADSLKEQAQRARRLARSILDDKTEKRLLAAAEDYEGKIEELRSDGTPPLPKSPISKS